MKFTIKRDDQVRSDAIVLGLFEKEKKPKIFSEGFSMPGAINRVLSDFQAKLYQTRLVYGAKGERFILLGLGKPKDFKVNSLRGAASKVGQAARGYRLNTISFSLSNHRVLRKLSMEGLAQAVAEGLLLGHYRYLLLKSKDDPDRPKDLRGVIIGAKNDSGAIRKGIDCAQTICDSVFLARDLAVTPGNLLTPSALARRAKSEAAKAGVSCQILDEAEIKKLKMGGILGVSQGSKQPPRLIVLKYNGARKRSDPPVALVGKGITFDSGGISIKPSSGMDKMKEDMGGAAAVIGAIMAVARLKLPVNVVAVVPSAENLPSGTAYKPGDVLTSYSGKTVEVLNTDAEGRLLLMDALNYSLKFKPAAIFDLATLTGACVVALGEITAGIMGRHPKLITQLKKASENTGERVWELPLWPEYAEQLKSDIADIKNIGGRWGGTITAGCFLAEFVEENPWAHIDIAGPVWTDKDEPYIPKGPTGYGVRLLVQLLRDWPKPKIQKSKKK